jgi:hypothetical protein
MQVAQHEHELAKIGHDVLFGPDLRRPQKAAVRGSRRRRFGADHVGAAIFRQRRERLLYVWALEERHHLAFHPYIVHQFTCPCLDNAARFAELQGCRGRGFPGERRQTPRRANARRA